MLLFAAAGADRLVRTEIDRAADASLLVAYGLMTRDDALKVVILNKNLDMDVTLTVDAHGARRGSVMRLVAPRPDDTTEVTFGGSAVGHDGAWTPTVTESLAARHGVLRLTLPKASGALLSLSA